MSIAGTYLIKNILQLKLRQCTALDVLDSSEILGHAFTILSSNWLHFLLGQLFSNAGILTQIDLGTDNQARHAGAVVMHLGEPFFADVFEGRGGCDAETNKEDIGLGV